MNSDREYYNWRISHGLNVAHLKPPTSAPEPDEPSTPLTREAIRDALCMSINGGSLHDACPQLDIDALTENLNAALAARSKAPADQKFLRTLVDVVWGHCYENGSVPATEVADKLIAKARVWAAAPKEGK